MKEKGMTLVELLAVIVVLAIVSLIAVPTVLNIINRARLNALKDSAYGLVEAGTLYNAQYQNDKNVRFDIKDNQISSKDTEDLLKFKGKVKEGTVIVNKNSKTTICITDGKNSAYKNYDETKVTLVKNQTCRIPENTTIVWLENDGATKDELSNPELTQKLIELEEKLDDVASIASSKANLGDVYPVGSIYISTTNTNPGTYISGTTWEAYGEGRTLVGVNSSDDNFKTVEKTGGSSTTTLDSKNLPSHSHTYTPSGNVSSTFTGSAATTSSTSKDLTGSFHIRDAVSNNGNHNLIFRSSGFISHTSIIQSSNYTLLPFASSSSTTADSVSFDATHTHNLTANGSVSSTFTGSQGTTSATGDGEAFSNLQPYITVYMWKRTA